MTNIQVGGKYSSGVGGGGGGGKSQGAPTYIYPLHAYTLCVLYAH